MECEKVIPEHVLVDLCSRFVINVPVEEQSDLIRICFQVELAHWFYIDFYSKNYPHKKPCGLKEFTLQVFKHIPFLQPFAKNIDEVIEEWKDYKFSVPTFGAIILDEDLSHVLLVQNYKSCWGFPKGKVNKDEPPYQCAIREVYEETGFDISYLIHSNDYIEVTINDRVIRLYIIPGVSKTEIFVPKTRNEIKAVNWFPICDIPLSKKDAAFKQLKNGGGNISNAVYSAFYMVSPFLKKLRQWIYDHINNIPRRKRRQRHKSCSDIDSMNISESVEMLKKFQSSDKPNFKNNDNAEEIPEEHELKSIETKNMKVKSKKSSGNLSASFGNSTVQDLHLIGSPEQISSRNSRQGDHGSKTIATNMTLSSELNYVLNLEKERMKSILDQKPFTGLQYQANTWSINTDSASGNLLSITSGDSAFRKVEKSTKSNRRRRKNKGTKDPGLTASDNTESIHPLSEHKIVTCIPSLKNFQFDITSIIQSMNEAVLKNDVK